MSGVLLTLYAVQNRDGQYFRAKGYGGSGETWVDSLTQARIYPRPGPARGQATFFATNYPSYGVPKLVELRVTEVAAFDETSRVQKSQQRKAKREAEWADEAAAYAKQKAECQLKEAQETLKRLRRAEADAERRRQERHT